MLFACLAIGFIFGASAATLTVVNGGGILLAILAYGSGGALAIVGILLYIALRQEEDASTELAEPVSA